MELWLDPDEEADDESLSVAGGYALFRKTFPTLGERGILSVVLVSRVPRRGFTYKRSGRPSIFPVKIAPARIGWFQLRSATDTEIC